MYPTVHAFLKTAKEFGIRGNDAHYCIARLTQVIGNAIGGTLSLGVGRYGDFGHPGDNGVYWIKNWEVVDSHRTLKRILIIKVAVGSLLMRARARATPELLDQPPPASQPVAEWPTTASNFWQSYFKATFLRNRDLAWQERQQ